MSSALNRSLAVNRSRAKCAVTASEVMDLSARSYVLRCAIEKKPRYLSLSLIFDRQQAASSFAATSAFQIFSGFKKQDAAASS